MRVVNLDIMFFVLTGNYGGGFIGHARMLCPSAYPGSVLLCDLLVYS